MAGMLGDDAEDLYELARMRRTLPRNDYLHGVVGPEEHRQFVQETVERNPLMALPMAAAIPAYTAGKAMGMFSKARSPASVDEIFAGYRGLAKGMLDRLVPSAHADHEQSETVQRPDGLWINVYGRRTPKAGQQLPGTGAYRTVEEAVTAARRRSAATKR